MEKKLTTYKTSSDSSGGWLNGAHSLFSLPIFTSSSPPPPPPPTVARRSPAAHVSNLAPRNFHTQKERETEKLTHKSPNKQKQEPMGLEESTRVALGWHATCQLFSSGTTMAQCRWAVGEQEPGWWAGSPIISNQTPWIECVRQGKISCLHTHPRHWFWFGTATIQVQLVDWYNSGRRFNYLHYPTPRKKSGPAFDKTTAFQKVILVRFSLSQYFGYFCFF